MLCLLTGSSRTVDRCEVCWTIFADQWTVVLYLVIKTGLGSVRETGKYSNLDLNWPSPPILLKLRIFLMETPKRVSDNQWRSADGQEWRAAPWVTGLGGWVPPRGSAGWLGGRRPVGHRAGWVGAAPWVSRLGGRRCPAAAPESLAVADSWAILHLHSYVMARELLLMR